MWKQRLYALFVLSIALLFGAQARVHAEETALPRKGYEWRMTEDHTLYIDSNAGWRHYQNSDFFPEPVCLVVGKAVTNMRCVEPAMYVEEYWEKEERGGFPICPEQIVIERGNKAFVLENGLLINTRIHTVVLSEKGLVDVVIPEGVTDIGTWAFMERGIRSVQLPKTLKRIHTKAFSSCEELTQICFPNALETIDKCAFLLCNELVSVSFPQSLKEIGISAFAGCNKLTDAALPDSLTTIGYDAFSNTSIQELHVQASKLKVINGFSDCAQLKKVVLPEGLERIGADAFSGCTALEMVDIPDTVTKIDAGAFENCNQLQQITLPVHLRTLGKGAFCYAGLRHIELPDGLREIHKRALQCGWIKYLDLPENCQVYHEDEIGVYSSKPRYVCTLGMNLVTLVVRAKQPVFPDNSLSVNHLENLLFFGAPPQGLDEAIPKDCTVYYLDEYAALWSPNGEDTWRGCPLVVTTRDEMETLAARLQREANS